MTLLFEFRFLVIPMGLARNDWVGVSQIMTGMMDERKKYYMAPVFNVSICQNVMAEIFISFHKVQLPI